MNNIGSAAFAANVFANVSTFNPAGRHAVGLESPDTKGDLIAPIEQAKQGNSTLNDDSNLGGFDNKAVSNNEDQQAAERQQALDEKDQQRRQAMEDQQLIRRLSVRDAEVRAHEAAHASVGGQFAGAPSFSFQRGPDGIDYAVGGEVRLSVPSGGANPELTLQALQQVRAAALAPANPSEQDRRVAAQAASQALELRAEIDSQKLQQKQQQLAEAAAEREAKAEQKKLDQEQSTDAVQQDDQRLARQQSGLRNTRLGEQLVTIDNLEKNNLGLLLSQRA